MNESLCVVCSTPLPEPTGTPGRPRKTCPDDTSPTPGGCARWRNIELTHMAYSRRPGTRHHSKPSPFAWFPHGGFLIE